MIEDLGQLGILDVIWWLIICLLILRFSYLRPLCPLLFKVMECRKKVFKISFKGLLLDVTQGLGLPSPIYSQIGMSHNQARVVIRLSARSQAHYFEGRKRKLLVHSEEDAAEKAIVYLARKHRLQIEDINLESKKRYKSCREFYLAMRAELGDVELAEIDLQSKLYKKKTLDYHITPVSINYRELLGDILAEYKICASPTETRKLESGCFMSCMSIECPGSEFKVEWLLGDSCDTFAASDKNLAKKAILYLQPIYNFEVRDCNYYRSLFAKARCTLERENFLNAKEKVIGVSHELEHVIIEDECRTPTEPHSQIASSTIAPPAPHKPKLVPLASSSSLVNNVVQIDSELALIFKPK